jgi:hypothetical protein
MVSMLSMAENGNGCRKDGRVGRIVNSHREHREHRDKGAGVMVFMVSMFSMVKKERANEMKDEYEIYLRPLRKEDAKTSWRWRNDPRVMVQRIWYNIRQ